MLGLVRIEAAGANVQSRRVRERTILETAMIGYLLVRLQIHSITGLPLLRERNVNPFQFILELADKGSIPEDFGYVRLTFAVGMGFGSWKPDKRASLRTTLIWLRAFILYQDHPMYSAASHLYAVGISPSK